MDRVRYLALVRDGEHLEVETRLMFAGNAKRQRVARDFRPDFTPRLEIPGWTRNLRPDNDYLCAYIAYHYHWIIIIAVVNNHILLCLDLGACVMSAGFHN